MVSNFTYFVVGNSFGGQTYLLYAYVNLEGGLIETEPLVHPGQVSKKDTQKRTYASVQYGKH